MFFLKKIFNKKQQTTVFSTTGNVIFFWFQTFISGKHFYQVLKLFFLFFLGDIVFMIH